MSAAVLGFLYPGHAAEDDYPHMAEVIGDVTVQVVHTPVGEDAHRVEALRDLGEPGRLLEGAEALGEGTEAVVWACTSGGFVLGWEGADRQLDPLRRHLGVPVSFTSFSFVEAARALKVERVTVGATYPADITDLFADFLARGGVEVLGGGSLGILTAEEVGTLGRERVLELARSADRPDAEALLLPDTALHTAAWVEDLEEAVGKPVLTANQVSMWHALRLAGDRRTLEGLGRLFRSG